MVQQKSRILLILLFCRWYSYCLTYLTSRIVVIAFIGWCRLNQLILAISAGEMPLGSPPPFAVNAQINSILSLLASLILSGFMYFFSLPN